MNIFNRQSRLNAISQILSGTFNESDETIPQSYPYTFTEATPFDETSMVSAVLSKVPAAASINTRDHETLVQLAKIIAGQLWTQSGDQHNGGFMPTRFGHVLCVAQLFTNFIIDQEDGLAEMRTFLRFHETATYWEDFIDFKYETDTDQELDQTGIILLEALIFEEYLKANTPGSTLTSVRMVPSTNCVNFDSPELGSGHIAIPKLLWIRGVMGCAQPAEAFPEPA